MPHYRVKKYFKRSKYLLLALLLSPVNIIFGLMGAILSGGIGHTIGVTHLIAYCALLLSLSVALFIPKLLKLSLVPFGVIMLIYLGLLSKLIYRIITEVPLGVFLTTPL